MFCIIVGSGRSGRKAYIVIFLKRTLKYIQCHVRKKITFSKVGWSYQAVFSTQVHFCMSNPESWALEYGFESWPYSFFFSDVSPNNNFLFQTQGYQTNRWSIETYFYFYFLQTLSPFSRLFQGLENCWANFKTFSRIQYTVRTLLVP